MAINLNDNIKINAGKPSESKYLSTGNTAYISISAVTAAISVSQRYVGLTVLVKSGSTNTEYWYRTGVTNTDLIEKKYDTILPIGDFVTGATNIGYFSGQTGVQILPIDYLVGFSSPYDGSYNSLYNYYYRGTDCLIHIGAPSDGIERRGYVKLPTIPNPTYKSWIWNDYIGGGNLLGWIFIDGDVANQLGTSPTFQTYYDGLTTFPYTQTSWTTGTNPNNGSNVVFSTIIGSLTTGATITIGARPYAFKDHNNLHVRTIVTETPNLLEVRDDETFIYLSATTAILGGQNIGGGSEVLVLPVTGTTLGFRTFLGSGDTTVTEVGNTIVIYSSGGTGGGTYNLSSPAVCTVGGISAGTALTGKTSFQLFEEILVPELCGAITPPSTSIGLGASGLYEIGCILSQTISGTFSRGLINPQYCSVSAFRSGCANAYSFTGTGMPPGFQACALSPANQTTLGYIVLYGTQSWGVCTRYNAGSPALGSKGTTYCAALASGNTTAASGSIVGVYPLFATTSNIITLTKQTLQNMSTANNIQINLVAESSPNKQKFEIPCTWLGAPTSRPLTAVCQWNTVSSQWEYPGGTAGTSLAIWTTSSATETVQGIVGIGYCQYTYNSTDRRAVCIRLVF
jgi:hypothetical protein